MNCWIFFLKTRFGLAFRNVLIKKGHKSEVLECVNRSESALSAWILAIFINRNSSVGFYINRRRKQRFPFYKTKKKKKKKKKKKWSCKNIGYNIDILHTCLFINPVVVENFAVLFICTITKTRLHNFDPLKPHFYIVKLGFTGVYIIFLISAQKHKLWWGGSNVLVRTASPRRF